VSGQASGLIQQDGERKFAVFVFQIVAWCANSTESYSIGTQSAGFGAVSDPQAQDRRGKARHRLPFPNCCGMLQGYPLIRVVGAILVTRNPFRATRTHTVFVYQSAPANRSWEWSKP